MSLISLIGLLLVLGVILWGVNAFPALDPTMKKIITVVVVVVAAMIVLSLFFPDITTIRVGAR